MKNDPPFKGVNFREAIQIKIPRAYWKVIVAINANDELEAFAFLLAQDLDQVAFEFQVSAEWEAHMVSIEHLEDVTKNIKFPKEVVNADQFGRRSMEEILAAEEAMLNGSDR